MISVAFCLYVSSGTEFDTVRSGFNALAFKFGRPSCTLSDRCKGGPVVKGRAQPGLRC